MPYTDFVMKLLQPLYLSVINCYLIRRATYMYQNTCINKYLCMNNCVTNVRMSHSQIHTHTYIHKHIYTYATI